MEGSSKEKSGNSNHDEDETKKRIEGRRSPADIVGVVGKVEEKMKDVFSSSCYISTDEVEMYCHRSRNQYFMVTKLRNYSTTAEATMTKFKLSSGAIYLGGNPKK